MNRRVEMLIQAESQFIELDDVKKLVFCREWSKHNQVLSSIEVHDKSDFFTALVKASRLLMGSDTEQPGHLIYITDGRLVMNDLQLFLGAHWFSREFNTRLNSFYHHSRGNSWSKRAQRVNRANSLQSETDRQTGLLFDFQRRLTRFCSKFCS